MQGGMAQEYREYLAALAFGSSHLDTAMGQKRPAPKGLSSEAPWQRRSACTGHQPALPPKGAVYPERLREQQPKGAAPPHEASEGNHGVQMWPISGLTIVPLVPGAAHRQTQRRKRN